MELKQIKYFISVVEQRNFTRAAEMNFVSQPNITMAIKKLEEELGAPLLQRGYKHIALTKEGEHFYSKTKDILQKLNNVVQEIRDSQQATGVVTIGIPPMIGKYLFDPLLEHFRKAYPQWELNIVVEGSLGIYERLLKGELDLAVLITNDIANHLASVHLFSSEHKLCVPVSHAFAKKNEIPFSDLRNESLIMMKLDSVHRKNVMQQCEKCGFMPRVVLSSNHVENNINSVANGIGLSFILDKIPLSRKDVKLVSMRPKLAVNIELVWSKSRYLSIASRDLIQFIQEYIRI